MYLDVEDSFEANLKLVEESDHARFPVVRGSMENVLGVINARQWLARAVRDPAARDLVEQPLKPALYVPETINGLELLDEFRLSDVQMAFVIDEYTELRKQEMERQQTLADALKAAEQANVA